MEIDSHAIPVGRLEIESITLGVSLRECSSRLVPTARARVYDRIRRCAGHLSACARETTSELGGNVDAVAISVSPLGVVFDGFTDSDFVLLAETLDRAAADVGVDRIGGLTSLAASAWSESDRALIHSIPHVMAATERVCASVECATTRAGINIPATEAAADVLLGETSSAAAAGRVAVLANSSGTSPSLPGAFHGIDAPPLSLKVAVSTGRSLDAVADLDLADAAIAASNLRTRLMRGGRFFGARCAALLADRSGLPVDIQRVVVLPPRQPASMNRRSQDDTPSPLQGGLLLRHPGFRSSEGSTGPPDERPILQRTSRQLTGTVSSRDLAIMLLHDLAGAVVGEFELEMTFDLRAPTGPVSTA